MSRNSNPSPTTGAFRFNNTETFHGMQKVTWYGAPEIDHYNNIPETELALLKVIFSINGHIDESNGFVNEEEFPDLNDKNRLKLKWLFEAHTREDAHHGTFNERRYLFVPESTRKHLSGFINKRNKH